MFVKKKGIKRKKKGAVTLFVISAAFIVLMLSFNLEGYYQSQIVMNEICSDNESYDFEEDGQLSDYIELYNKGKYDYKIRGLYLSDDPYDLKKISLDGVELKAGEVYLVSCKESGSSFSINKKGEVIYLSNEDGKILEKVETGKLESDTAYIRNKNGEWQIGSCTPGMHNNEIRQVQVEMPELSHTSGFYDAAFELEITGSEDTVIYYTLDGSVPDEGSAVYEAPIKVYDKSEEPNVGLAVQNVVRNWQEYEPDSEPVEKAFLIRAIAIDSAGNKSDVVTATYFINREDFETRRVVSIVTDPENLYSDEKGIYVTGAEFDEWYLSGKEDDQPIPNFRKKGREWEREAVFELFDDTEPLLQQNVGIRIQGSGSRELAMKRFSVYAREEYSGSDYFDIPFYDSDIKTHSVVLRTNIGDCICQGLLTDRDIPHQRYQRVYVFLNGEYIYGSYLQEKYNDQYFEDYYGIDKDNLIVIEGNGVNRGVETDMIHYQELYRFIEENDFSDDAMYRELGDRMDIQSYIDFVAANIYCANMDVEMENTKNVMMWRSREAQEGKYGDTKWRFALYDMDSFQFLVASDYGNEISAQIDVFNNKFSEDELSYNESVIYSALRKNNDFCKQFVITCMDMMNTSFSVENATAVLERLGRNIEWCDSFFLKRPEYMKQHVAKEFELTGSIETVTLFNENESEGKIILNTITPSMKNGSWMGEYFTDYPVTVTAEPMEGYEFTGWSGSIESDEITIEVPITEGGIELRAEFQKIE